MGERALLALAAAGRPLHGIDLAFRHVRYDWRRPQGLRAVLRPSRRAGALVACSPAWSGR